MIDVALRMQALDDACRTTTLEIPTIAHRLVGWLKRNHHGHRRNAPDTRLCQWLWHSLAQVRAHRDIQGRQTVHSSSARASRSLPAGIPLEFPNLVAHKEFSGADHLVLSCRRGRDS